MGADLPHAKRPLSDQHKELLKLLAQRLVEDFRNEQEGDQVADDQQPHADEATP